MNFFDDDFVTTDIEDCIDSPLLNSLSKAIRAGLKILEVSALKPNLKQHDIIILAIFRKLLEQADGLFVLLDHDSNSAATSTIRSLYETSLGLQYILEDPQELERRATAYRVSYLNELLYWAENAQKKGDLSTVYSDKQLNENIVKIKSLLNQEPLKTVNKEWLKQKKKLESRKKIFFQNGIVYMMGLKFYPIK